MPLDLLDEFETAVTVEDLVLNREARPAIRASASMTLLMFTGVGLFLTKAYFDGLLNELGKAHAGVLDAALRQLGQRLMTLRGRRMAAEATAVENRYSPLLSVWVERDADSQFKLLLPAGLPPDALDAALSAYLAFAEAYHTDRLDPEDLEVLAWARPLAGVVLLAWDEESFTIQPVDPFEGRGSR